MDDDTIIGFSDIVQSKPEVKQKNGKRSGGFQAMGLSFPVLKGVLKRGYKVPTPIQRKVLLNQDIYIFDLVKHISSFMYVIIVLDDSDCFRKP